MIENVHEFLKSYDELREDVKSKKLPNNDWAIDQLKSTFSLDISYECLTEDDTIYIELCKIELVIKELIEHEDDIRDFFEDNNHPLKESFLKFYQAYSDLKEDKKNDSQPQKPKFKNFLYNLHGQGN